MTPYPKTAAQLMAACIGRIKVLRTQATPDSQRLLSKLVLVVEELKKRGTVGNAALSKERPSCRV